MRATSFACSIRYVAPAFAGIVLARPAGAQISAAMLGGIPTAHPVAVYSAAERATMVQRVLRLAARPVLGAPVSLTPNAPLGPDGSHLSFWKPSFVLGTSSGGEAGVNFWGIHNEGHINVGFTPHASKSWLLDCRLLSPGRITYKIFAGEHEDFRGTGDVALDHNHFILLVPVSRPGDIISVELWPTPVTETMGFLGCDLSAID